MSLDRLVKSSISFTQLTIAPISATRTLWRGVHHFWVKLFFSPGQILIRTVALIKFQNLGILDEIIKFRYFMTKFCSIFFQQELTKYRTNTHTDLPLPPVQLYFIFQLRKTTLFLVSTIRWVPYCIGKMNKQIKINQQHTTMKQNRTHTQKVSCV